MYVGSTPTRITIWYNSYMPYKDKEAQRKYQREWRMRRRNDFFQDKFCLSCRSTNQLELDHVDPQKKITHAIWSWTQTKREAELAKCQVLCHECHVKKTTAEQHVSGERNGSAKITVEDVVKIRERYSSGKFTYQMLGDEYNVHKTTIRMIVLRRKWKVVK